MLLSRCMYRWFFVVLGGLWGCPSPPSAPVGSPTDSGPASQPASSASSKAAMPEGHDTSTRAVTLDDVFKLPETPEVVAKVNDRAITRAMLEERLRQAQVQVSATGVSMKLTRYQALRDSIDGLVDRELQRALAAKLGVTVDPKAVDAWLVDLEERIKTTPSFRAFLLRAGKDEAARRRDAEQAVEMDTIVLAIRAQVEKETEIEAKQYYDQNSKQYLEREGRETWRIFIKAPKGMIQRDRDVARARAEELHGKAKKDPKSFESLAISFSEGGNATQGGFIGWLGRGTLVPELEAQIYAAKPNTILPLYEDAGGFYIYKVGQARKERQLPFEEVKGQIMDQVYRTTIQRRIDTEIEALRKAQQVQIFIPELEQLEAGIKAAQAEGKLRPPKPPEAQGN